MMKGLWKIVFSIFILTFLLLPEYALAAATDTFEGGSGLLKDRTNWVADDVYTIASGEVHNPGLNGWGDLAIYKPGTVTNPVTAAIKYSAENADEKGISSSGILMLMDAASISAKGYFVQAKSGTIYLYVVSAGNLQTPELAKTTYTANNPQPGDELRVTWGSDSNGYYFKVYFNGTYIGVVRDKSPTHAPTTYYSGFMLYGAKGDGSFKNSHVEEFSIDRDETAPAAITNLAAGSPTESSVVLNWTATGDDGNSGTAQSYDIRYSTSNITNNDQYNNATQAANEPTPKAAGSAETFTVTGLSASTTYYFAIKALDDGGNVSPLSNVPSATTLAPAGNFTDIIDNFDRPGPALGKNWVTDPGYSIQNGELNFTGTGWGHLAVFKPSVKSKSTAFKWSVDNSSATGRDAGGICILTDSTVSANGYLIIRRSSDNRATLYKISGGNTAGTLMTEYNPKLSAPVGGDVIKIEPDFRADKNVFFIYINGVYDCYLQDASADRWAFDNGHYSGVMLYGDPARKHNLDDFTVQVPKGEPTSIVKYFDPFQNNNNCAEKSVQYRDSLAVQVVDQYNNPASGIIVDFAVTSGSATLSIDNMAFDGKIWYEAEDGKVSAPMQKFSDASAGGGAYVMTPTVTGNYDKGTVDFDIYIPVAGTYRLWVRRVFPSSSSNTFWVKWDSSPDSARWEDFNYGDSYQWMTKDPPFYNVTKGFHKLRIRTREMGVKIDKILLTNSGTVNPNNENGGLGYPTTQFPNITNAKGIASTFVTVKADQNPYQSVIMQASAIGLQGSPVQFTIPVCPPPAREMKKVSGDNQNGFAAGTQLTQPLVVQLFDVDGREAPGHRVTFRVTRGGGTVASGKTSEVVVTDGQGKASIYWTMGFTDETQTVEATASVEIGSPQVFTATNVTGIPRNIALLDGNNQSGKAGFALANPLRVKVTDKNGGSVRNYEVTFSVLTGNGSFDNTKPKTDVNGIAQAYWTLGGAVGTQTAKAEGSGLTGSPVNFTATAIQGDPSKLTKISGDNQTGPIGEPLERAYVVQVTDVNNNAIPGHAVRFEVTAGGGSIKSRTVVDTTTDASGYASVFHTMGSTENVTNTVQVSSNKADGNPLTGSPMFFNATSGPGRASVLLKEGGDNQSALVKTQLPTPIKVKVTDPFGNPKSGHSVTFKIKTGGGNLGNQRIQVNTSTSAEGFAQVDWTLGELAGRQELEVTSNRDNGKPLDNSPMIFVAKALPGNPVKIVKIDSTDFQTGKAGQVLLKPMQAKVADQYNNGVPDQTVRFEVKAGGGNIEGNQSANMRSDSSGIAQVFFTVGPTPGVENNKVQASASYNNAALTGSPVTFTASTVVGDATFLLQEKGNGQTGTVETPLPDSFVVKVTDRFNNPISGHLVTFMVKTGLGNISGATELTLPTGANGKCGVILTLGPLAGTNNNTVTVTAGANIDPVTFFASAKAGLAHAMAIVKGNEQSGTVGQNVTEPLEVRVTDQKGNAIANHKVTFKVLEPIDGPGKVDGLAQIDKFTNANGLASVIFTLGSKPGTLSHKVEATSINAGQPLSGSPIVFRLSAIAGDPDQLVKVSGDSLTGVVGNPLEEWFRVMVADNMGNPIPNHPVIFEVKLGGGVLGERKVKIDTIKTAPNGIAQTWLTLGTEAGAWNNVVEVRGFRMALSGPALRGSGLRFYATAKPSDAEKLAFISGDRQIGVVGMPLPQPFVVKTADKNNNPVSGHSVTFQVISGGGLLDGTSAQKTVKSGINGLASVTLTLGITAGDTNKVRIWSTDGFKDLDGSPIQVFSIPNADLPDPNMCSMVADPEALNADGVTEAQIKVFLRDRFNNPVPGKNVSLIDSTGFLSIDQPLVKTNASGQISGFVKSKKAGTFKLYAYDLTDERALNCSARLIFRPLGAHKIEYFAGGNQSGNLGTVLAQPFQVVVTDQGGNTIPNYPVFFAVTSGGGTIVNPQPTRTDSAGVASSQLRLGLRKGTNVVEIRAQGPTGSPLIGSPVIFTAEAKEGIPNAITVAGGNNQKGPAGGNLPQPLLVKVIDAQGNPVAGVKIRFSVVLGGGVVNPDTATTDLTGHASTFAQLGGVIGENLYRAEVTHSPFLYIILSATASVGEKDRLWLVTGNRFEGTVGMQLPLPLQVKVTDKYGNPVSGVMVNYRILSGGAVISGSGVVYTDRDGIASAAVTLGTLVGLNHVEASSPGLRNSPQLFELYGLSGPGITMEEHAGNRQSMSRSRELNYPISVRVRDQYGNPAQNSYVSFVILQGGGQIVGDQRVLSDENGLASARWRLGPMVGTNKAMAYAGNLRPADINFNAESVVNEFPVINCPASVAVWENETVSFEVTATDADDPTSSIKYGTRLLKSLPGNASFDSTGTYREFRWTPPSKTAGDYEVEFTAQDQKGDLTVARTIIKVKSTNRPPVISSFAPPILVDLAFDEQRLFSVTAADPDGDPLTYRWYCGNLELPSRSALTTIRGSDLGIGQFEVCVEVSDGEETVTPPCWIVIVSLTSVELENFSAQAVDYRGVVLEWTTSREVDNAGFNILRGQTQDGKFIKINPNLIAQSSEGSYRFLDKDVKAGNTYYYKLEDVDVNGNRTLHEAVAVTVPIPRDFELAQNYPNPFNPSTSIRFTVPELTRVSIMIYNIMGQKVRTLIDDKVEPGFHELIWDGKDDNGHRVGSGIYYYRMTGNHFNDVKKMALLK